MDTKPGTVFFSPEHGWMLDYGRAYKSFHIVYFAIDPGSNSIQPRVVVGQELIHAIDSEEAKKFLLARVVGLGLTSLRILRCTEEKVWWFARMTASFAWWVRARTGRTWSATSTMDAKQAREVLGLEKDTR